MWQPMTPILETDRLILKPLQLEDAAATQRLFPHWEIVRFLNEKIPWPYPEDEAFRFYRDVALPRVAQGLEWIWAIRLKDGPEHLIGSINLSMTSNDNRGFWLGLPWQSRGLMSEACVAVTEFWFNDLEKNTLTVAKAVGNAASRRISEKQGARLIAIEPRNFVSGRLPAEIWELTKNRWNARPE